MFDIDRLSVSPASTLREVIACIDRNTTGMALIVDGERRLCFTMTDGDLRRAVLHGLDLTMSASTWAAQTRPPGYAPVTAAAGTPVHELRRLMREHSVRHLPILDADRRVIDVVMLHDLATAPAAGLQAVVMAGGQGTRLRPLTASLPKPMLPVGDRPLIEHIVHQLRDAGIARVSITTHFQSESIVNHLGNGKAFGVDIDYVNEDQPLGTAGSLALLSDWDSPLLVMNGDILTRINHRSMFVFHQENDAAVTVGVRQYDVQVPYGVLETDGLEVKAVNEKPMFRFFVNAGIYLLEPRIKRYLKRGERLDMTDLLLMVLADNQRVISFPISEDWLDIGQLADYEKAQAQFSKERQ
jgi:dTDP-glucose pyrophosphorylase/CBS domain-containing protein